MTDPDADAIETARLETLGRLAHRVAHDSNNLLMVVLGHADLILATAESPDAEAWVSVREDADQVCRASRAAGDLMRQLLDFARAGGDEVGPLRLDRLLKEMGPLLRVAVPKTTALTVDVAPVAVTVRARPVEIRQLMTQLTLNAVDSMTGEGGRVTVRLRVDEPAETAEDTMVSIEVVAVNGTAAEADDRLPFGSRRPGVLHRGHTMAALLARRNDGRLGGGREEDAAFRMRATFPCR